MTEVTVGKSVTVPTLPYGTYSRIARRLRNKQTGKPLATNSVRDVWHAYWQTGATKSGRILKALLREYAKQRAAAEQTPTASAA